MYELKNFTIHGDHAGNLVALEKGIDFGFDVKRIYYIWGTEKTAIRGKHAHQKLKQLIICLAGNCDFYLDDGKKKTKFFLSNPSQGLYIESFVWREFTNFSPDCIVMVLASEHYEETDYIKDYERFMEHVRNDSSP